MSESTLWVYEVWFHSSFYIYQLAFLYKVELSLRIKAMWIPLKYSFLLQRKSKYLIFSLTKKSRYLQYRNLLVRHAVLNVHWMLFCSWMLFTLVSYHKILTCLSFYFFNCFFHFSVIFGSRTMTTKTSILWFFRALVLFPFIKHTNHLSTLII